MRYCPHCKINYDIIQDFCPACHSTLIDLLNGKQGAARPDDSWVVVGGVNNDLNFEIAKGTLDSNNITAVFLGSSEKDDHQIITSLIADDDDSNIIMVPKEFKFEALFILIDILGDKFKKVDSNDSLL